MPMDETLPNPVQRNAVSFKERPKMTKTKSFKTKSLKVLSPDKASPTLDLKTKPALEVDDEDDFGPRAESDDSDDYDGVPRTEEVPMITTTETKS